MSTSIRTITTLLALSTITTSCTRDETRSVDSHRTAAVASELPGPTGARPSPSAAKARSAFAAPYPRAAWRLAKPDDLDRVVLWFSHILVRHTNAREEVSFNIGFWSSVPPLPTRTRDEALALAEQVAEQAEQDPTSFPELARRYTEDLPSRDEGGAMGGYRASVLMLWPHVLDALAALRPGQTSRVVETAYGLHVFYRSAPPPEALESGAHIVIGHDQAPWLEVFARGQKPTRTREQALALANRVYREASAAPQRFGELVKKYSEHSDAVIAGDFGTWSTREGCSFPARMKRLHELAPGTVGAPIETHLGFEIVERTPLGPRRQYRAQMAVFPFEGLDDRAPGADAAARANALAQAQAATKLLLRDPSQINSVGAARIVRQWEDARELPELGVQLERIPVGHITARPATSQYGFLVAQRLPPEPVEARTFRTELPAPEQPDLDSFVDSISPEDTRTFLRQFAGNVTGELDLSGPEADDLRSSHEVGERLPLDASDETRKQVVSSTMEATRKLLGARRFAIYRAALNRHVAHVLLNAPADSARERGF
jgi:hypothetical protein